MTGEEKQKPVPVTLERLHGAQSTMAFESRGELGNEALTIINTWVAEAQDLVRRQHAHIQAYRAANRALRQRVFEVTGEPVPDKEKRND